MNKPHPDAIGPLWLIPVKGGTQIQLVAEDAAGRTRPVNRHRHRNGEHVAEAHETTASTRPPLKHGAWTKPNHHSMSTHSSLNGHSTNGEGKQELQSLPGRTFRRARYFALRNVNSEGLASTRAKVYQAIRSSGDSGLTSHQLRTVCKLSHGSVQQTLNWLRREKLVTAVESEL